MVLTLSVLEGLRRQFHQTQRACRAVIDIAPPRRRLHRIDPAACVAPTRRRLLAPTWSSLPGLTRRSLLGPTCAQRARTNRPRVLTEL